MTITITSTDEIGTFGPFQCRIWKGVTDQGTPFDAMVAGVRVPEGHSQAEFAALVPIPKPIPVLPGLDHLRN